jgi:hypothetical protein
LSGGFKLYSAIGHREGKCRVRQRWSADDYRASARGRAAPDFRLAYAPQGSTHDRLSLDIHDDVVADGRTPLYPEPGCAHQPLESPVESLKLFDWKGKKRRIHHLMARGSGGSVVNTYSPLIVFAYKINFPIQFTTPILLGASYSRRRTRIGVVMRLFLRSACG